MYRESSHSTIAILLDVHETTIKFKLPSTAIFCSVQHVKPSVQVRSEIPQRDWVKPQDRRNVL